uniref:Uncharacterized protein n=1 Tax=Rhizophora mucronata TaxID=61149 RepID=A0A2P2NQ14_RHIMU
MKTNINVYFCADVDAFTNVAISLPSSFTSLLQTVCIHKAVNFFCYVSLTLSYAVCCSIYPASLQSVMISSL